MFDNFKINFSLGSAKTDKKEQKEKTIEEQDQEYYRSFGLKETDSSNNSFRNHLMASLIGLSTLGFAVPLMIIENDDGIKVNKNNHIEVVNENVNQLLDEASKSDSLIKTNDLYDKLDKTKLENLSESNKQAIKTVVKASMQPVKLKGFDDKKRVSDQLYYAQQILDNAIEKSISTPKANAHMNTDNYQYEYITGKDLCRDIDFSKILIYQKDLSIIKNIISSNMTKIKRFEPGAIKKYEAELEKAQNTVNYIAEGLKTRSYAIGNTNGDKILSREEFLGALYTDNMNDLPKDVQQRLLNEVVPKNFKYDLSNINTIADAKKTNAQYLGPILQKAQNKLDQKIDSVRAEEFKRNNSDLAAN